MMKYAIVSSVLFVFHSINGMNLCLLVKPFNFTAGITLVTVVTEGRDTALHVLIKISLMAEFKVLHLALGEPFQS